MNISALPPVVSFLAVADSRDQEEAGGSYSVQSFSDSPFLPLN